ncbi:winged helix-turn-helix domain-containing protein [Fructilactobacillus sp. Tb1]|uniref:winged helix-turn-helix domain-containing protein n=1 Tax=Fructilactobacillus sp. Tb1 TaxID=3422304 RepID=UPI003D2D5021
MAINMSQAFNEQEYFVDTVDQISHVDRMMVQKQSVGLFWDLDSFPFSDNQDKLSKIRRHHQIPIIMLAKDKNETIDVIKAGFDDVVVTPFDFQELMARLQQKQDLYARLGLKPINKDKHQKPSYVVGDVVIDRQKYKAFKNEKDLGLTPKELKLLVYLIENSPNVLSRQQLLEGVWGDLYDVSQTSRMVDIHISHLRDKIEPDPKHPQYLKTVRGFGYHFVGDFKKIS